MELRIASYRALVAKSFDSSGRLNFDSIYSGSSPAADAADDKGVDKARAVTRGTDAVTRGTGRPLKLEICSGAGEWAVAQVLTDYADRCSSTPPPPPRHHHHHQAACMSTK